MIRLLITHGVAGFGVFIFILLGLPLPWLLGPITACLIAALCGVQMKGIPIVNNAMRSILGVAVGATFTVSLIISMADMWATLILVPVMVFLIGLVGVPYFQRLWGFDFATSYYSAMPGGLGYWGVDLSNPPGAPAATLPVSQMALMVVAGLAGWQIAKAVGLFGASILGPMILAGIMALLGILQYRPPAEAIWAAQFFIGMTVGTKYAGVTGAEVRRDVAAALGFCLILLVLAAIFVEIIHLFSLAPPMEALLAFAPGGQAEMTVLALIAGADMAFVIAHHVLRIVTVIVGAPIAAKFFNR